MIQAIQTHLLSTASLNQIVGILNDDHRVKRHLQTELTGSAAGVDYTPMLVQNFKNNFWDSVLSEMDLGENSLIPAKEYFHDKSQNFMNSLLEAIEEEYPLVVYENEYQTVLVTFDYDLKELNYSLDQLMGSGDVMCTMRSLNWEMVLYTIKEMKRVRDLKNNAA